MMPGNPKDARTPSTPSGSPLPGEPVFIAVGFLRRAHGIRGEIVMDVLTDFPERLRPQRMVYAGEEHRPVRIQSVRWHNQVMLVKIRGYDTPEAAAALRNTTLYVRVEELPPLPEGEYYHHQLIGLRVMGEDGSEIGVLAEIVTTGANDVYGIRKTDGGELLIPAIEDVVLNVDLERGEMTVRLQEWG
jgi:16S rRNA processing protein RimM